MAEIWGPEGGKRWPWEFGPVSKVARIWPMPCNNGSERGAKMVFRDRQSIRRQNALLTLSRSNLFYAQKDECTEYLRVMEIIDKQLPETPWYGSRQMARYIKRYDRQCGRHHFRRLMRLMRLVPV